MASSITAARGRDPRLGGAALALALAGCANLPPPVYPSHTDAMIAVRCVVPASGRLRVPASTADLVVRALRAEPPPRGESFDLDGARWLHYPAGTEVVVRGDLRVYRTDAGPGLDANDRRGLFPDAVEWLPSR